MDQIDDEFKVLTAEDPDVRFRSTKRMLTVAELFGVIGAVAGVVGLVLAACQV
ncbi:hypothetical protein E4U41_005236 [Claviceps citrina]|nr:hypothetical protein E4U41_005236 [Claviceps citrina]